MEELTKQIYVSAPEMFTIQLAMSNFRCIAQDGINFTWQIADNFNLKVTLWKQTR